jgi:hypothetical protein
MSWDEPLPMSCEEDGKGGCKKHPPTIRLTQFQWWLIDEHCPGQRVLWPAVQYHKSAGYLPEPVAEAYYYLIDPKYPPSFKNSILRRVQKAEKLRLKEMRKGGGA